LCALILLGAGSPITAAADPTPTPTLASPADQGASTPHSSTSYSLSPKQFGLSISPTRLVVSPNDIDTTQEITVANRGQAPLTVTVDTRNFTTGSTGSLDYQKDSPYGAASWLTVGPTHFTLAPGEAQVVTADITPPDSPEAGDHQVALVFLIPGGTADGNIKINRGIASPVYITVPGETDDSVSLSGLRAPRFAKGGPVTVTATVRNLGTVHRDFRAPAPLTIDSGGSKTPFPDFTVPRDSTRSISAEWDPPLICVCHPTVHLANTGQATQAQSVRVIIFPWHLLAMLVGGLLVVLVAIRTARRRYRAQVMKAAARQSQVSSGNG
jgi:hypothetical protein